MRFRAEQHLSRQTEIRAVRENGQRLDCRAFTVWWRQRDKDPADAAEVRSERDLRKVPTGARVCVIASTAAVGNAVRRNRAKRRLREVFRHQQSAVPAECDLLLIARGAAVAVPMPEMMNRFSDACRRIETQLKRS